MRRRRVFLLSSKTTPTVKFMTDFQDEQTLIALIPSDATVAINYSVIMLSFVERNPVIWLRDRAERNCFFDGSSIISGRSPLLNSLIV